jgi:hypothetical protein
VYIAVTNPFTPSVNVEHMLEEIEERAYDECGEYGCDWKAFNPKKQDELKELQSGLDAVLFAWMKKYGYYPGFYLCEQTGWRELEVKADE